MVNTLQQELCCPKSWCIGISRDNLELDISTRLCLTKDSCKFMSTSVLCINHGNLVHLQLCVMYYYLRLGEDFHVGKKGSWIQQLECIHPSRCSVYKAQGHQFVVGLQNERGLLDLTIHPPQCRLKGCFCHGSTTAHCAMHISHRTLPAANIQGVFFTGTPLKVLSTKKLIQARLGVSRPRYVNVESPNLGFPYFNFVGGYQ